MPSRWSDVASAYATSFAALCAGPVPVVLDRLGPPGPDAQLLDVGTGTGTVLAAAAARGWRATGCDAEESMVRHTGTHWPGVAVAAAALPSLPYRAGAFAAVVANFVVNHVAEPARSVRELLRVVRPAGTVAITVWPGTGTSLTRLWDRVIDDAGVTRPPAATLSPDLDFERTEPGLRRLVTAAGAEDVTVETVDWTFRAGPESLWAGVEGGVATIGAVYAAQTDDGRQRLRRAFEDRVAASASNGDFELSVSAILALARTGARRS